MSERVSFEKPFSQACENNKAPILQHLQQHLSSAKKVLEVGSGTGQHAVYFAKHLPHLQWHCADQIEYHPGINAWIDEQPSDNLHRPIALRLPHDPWPCEAFDAVYSANTAHIMQKTEVQLMMQKIDAMLPNKGIFCQYGPFTINGKFSTQSNAEFHEKLIDSGYGGYRDIEEIKQWCNKLKLSTIVDMPANNMLLVWQK